MAASKNQSTSVDTLKSYESQLSTIFGFVIVVAIGVGLLFLLRKTSLNNTAKISEKGSETTSEETLKKESEEGKYTVKAGDNLWKIAESEMKDGYQWTTLANANGIKSPYVVTEGQKLTIPTPDPKIENLMTKADKPVATSAPVKEEETKMTETAEVSGTHTVAVGENLWKIAVTEYKDGYKWVEIYRANKALIGTNPGIIRVGQKLTIPSLK